jgi:hypothetical protein
MSTLLLDENEGVTRATPGFSEAFSYHLPDKPPAPNRDPAEWTTRPSVGTRGT